MGNHKRRGNCESDTDSLPSTHLFMEAEKGNHHYQNRVEPDEGIRDPGGEPFQGLDVGNGGNEKGKAVGQSNEQQE